MKDEKREKEREEGTFLDVLQELKNFLSFFF